VSHSHNSSGRAIANNIVFKPWAHNLSEMIIDGANINQRELAFLLQLEQ